MTEWFRETFEEEYLELYAHRDEEEAERTVSWLCTELGFQQGKSVLDSPCGGGRHSRAFSRRGFLTVGIDLSRDLLHHARIEHGPSERLLYVRGDLRALPVASNAFDLVTNLFSSFGYFETEEENMLALSELVRATRRGGWLVIDFMNEPHVRANLVERTERVTPDGWEVTEERRITGQPPRIEKHGKIRFPSGKVRQFYESVRLYTPEELSKAMQRMGLVNIRLFGDYAGTPYSSAAPRAIFIGQKP